MANYGILEGTGYALWAENQRKEFRDGYRAACQGLPLDKNQCWYYQRGYWVAEQDISRR